MDVRRAERSFHGAAPSSIGTKTLNTHSCEHLSAQCCRQPLDTWLACSLNLIDPMRGVALICAAPVTWLTMAPDVPSRSFLTLAGSDGRLHCRA